MLDAQNPRAGGLFEPEAQGDAPRALEHLTQYEAERRPRAPAPPPVPTLPNAWVGCIIYVITLIAIGLLISNGFWRLDAFDAGELDAARRRSRPQTTRLHCMPTTEAETINADLFAFIKA